MNDLATRLVPPVRAARRLQLAVVVVGMITGYLFPMAQRVGSDLYLPMAMAGGLAAWIGTPLLYMAFAGAVERAVVAAGGALPERRAKSLAPLMFIPGIGFFVEIAILYRLAKMTETVTDEVGRSNRVLWLAIARPIWMFIGFPLAIAGSLGAGDLLSLALSSLAPLGSLVLLGLATQMIMQPLLDRAAGGNATLGATGAETSAAFSSSSLR